MRKSAKENIMVVCTVVLCFMLTIGLCTAFSGKGILSVFSFGKNGGNTVYAVAVGGYSDMTLARSTADLIKGRGGAGYVVESDSIEIIYAVYSDETSANKVLGGLGENGAYVKKIEIVSSKLKWADGNIKSAVQNALNYYGLAFETLYTTANNLADGSVNTDDANTQIKVLYARINDLKCDFYQKTIGEDNAKITEVKLALITALALLENIKSSATTALHVSSIRYALVQLVFCNQALMRNI